jgi:hypothetical protein
VWSQTTLAETFPDHPSSPFFPQTPILFLPPPLLVSFECLPTSQEVLYIAFGKLSRFNILSWLLASAEGLISASTRCPKPRSTTFSEFFGVGVFLYHTRRATVIQASFAPLGRQQLLLPTTTRRSVFSACPRVDLTRGWRDGILPPSTIVTGLSSSSWGIWRSRVTYCLSCLFIFDVFGLPFAACPIGFRTLLDFYG